MSLKALPSSFTHTHARTREHALRILLRLTSFIGKSPCVITCFFFVSKLRPFLSLAPQTACSSQPFFYVYIFLEMNVCDSRLWDRFRLQMKRNITADKRKSEKRGALVGNMKSPPKEIFRPAFLQSRL